MKNSLPVKSLFAECLTCGAYNVCDYMSAEECPTLQLRKNRSEPKPDAPSLESTLSRMDRLLTDMEASTRRLAAIIEKM